MRSVSTDAEQQYLNLSSRAALGKKQTYIDVPSGFLSVHSGRVGMSNKNIEPSWCAKAHQEAKHTHCNVE